MCGARSNTNIHPCGWSPTIFPYGPLPKKWNPFKYLYQPGRGSSRDCRKGCTLCSEAAGLAAAQLRHLSDLPVRRMLPRTGQRRVSTACSNRNTERSPTAHQTPNPVHESGSFLQFFWRTQTNGRIKPLEVLPILYLKTGIQWDFFYSEFCKFT